MSLEQIKYKWENGVLSKEQMCELLEQNIIQRSDFFQITRLYYDLVRQNIEEQKKRGYRF